MTEEEIVWYIRRKKNLFLIMVLIIMSMNTNIPINSFERTAEQFMQKEEQIVKAEIIAAEPQQSEVEELNFDKIAYYRSQISDLSDKELLASLMYHEEGVLLSIIDYEDAKMAHLLAGSVIIHRTNMNFMGAENFEQTIFAEGQYAEKTLKKLSDPVPEEVIEWAGDLMENGPLGPKDMIYQAQFKQGADVYKQIYNQYFCTDTQIIEKTE